jgi:hypothetical protein
MGRELSAVVKMRSYFSLPDGGPKTYCRREALSPFITDANSCGLMQIIDHIAEHDPDVEIVDEDDEDIPPFSYDVDDPCIEVGVVFPDVKQCKEAVTQHAIIHDHAFKATRTDHNKFRAVCKRADKGCKWRFYATTSKNKYIGCKVKYIYTCIFMCCSKNKYITYSCVILMCCR